MNVQIDGTVKKAKLSITYYICTQFAMCKCDLHQVQHSPTTLLVPQWNMTSLRR